VSPFVSKNAGAQRPASGLLAPLVLPDDLRPATAAPDAPAPGSTLGQHYARCYGCGVAQPAGLHMTFTVGDDVQVISEFVVTEDHEGAPGLAHGGLLTAALDETQATLLWVLRMPAVTARLETDFLAPVPVGSIVRIEARCLGLSDRKIFTSAEGLLVAQHGDSTGVLAVRSSALFVTVPVEHFTAFGRADLVEASMNRGSDVPRIEVNP
jgi:acyl-coenzyme A thioesterase PaaI-like protein